MVRSAISGKRMSRLRMPLYSIFSRIERSQAMWLVRAPTESPRSWQPRASNSSCILPKSMNSEVHTGVKSPGWLKRMIHFPLKSCGKRMCPCVVSASNSGAFSPRPGMLQVVFSMFFAFPTHGSNMMPDLRSRSPGRRRDGRWAGKSPGRDGTSVPPFRAAYLRKMK